MRQWKKTRAQKQKSRDEQKSGGSPARGPGAPCGPHARFLPASDPAPVFVFIARGFFIVSQRFPGPRRGIFGFKNNCGFVFFWLRINRRRKKLEDPRTRERGPSCAVPIPPPFCAGFRSGPPSSCASFRPRRPPAAAREAPRGSGPRGSRTLFLGWSRGEVPARYLAAAAGSAPAPAAAPPAPPEGRNERVGSGWRAGSCLLARRLPWHWSGGSRYATDTPRHGVPGSRGIGRQAPATLRVPSVLFPLPSVFFPPEFKWAPQCVTKS